jgi:hypothetical protein
MSWTLLKQIGNNPSQKCEMVSVEVAGENGMVKEFCVWQHIEPILAKLSSVGLASQMPSLSLSLSLFFLSFRGIFPSIILKSIKQFLGCLSLSPISHTSSS